MKPIITNNSKHSLDHFFFICLPRLAFSLLLFLSLLFTLFTLKSLYTPIPPSSSSSPYIRVGPDPDPPTGLEHVVFGIGASARHWARRRHFVGLWWRPESRARGFVFLDQPVNLSGPDLARYPELRVSSSNASRVGRGNGPRMARIVSELARMELPGARWFVMGDDDTVFYPENLVRVLRKYDHTRMYYIGSNSETHLQNVRFSYEMAYGGGGFAISYGLARELERMQERCMERYPDLFGSDDRVEACLAELGVPLTREPGFHQFDIYGNLFGLLSAHPVAPLVSMHHLDILEPIFPTMGRLQALAHLSGPASLDSGGLMQQSICYDPTRNWTLSVSWGYTVQIIRGAIPAREMERPARTFVDWYKRDDPAGFSFNTRPFSKHPCQKPYIYYLSNASMINDGISDNNGISDDNNNVSETEYVVHKMPHPWCWWKVANPERIQRIVVYKKPNPHRWDPNQAPRRDCCRVLPTKKEGTLSIDVGECREGEVMEPPLLV